jgi:beta-galactosidase GanA
MLLSERVYEEYKNSNSAYLFLFWNMERRDGLKIVSHNAQKLKKTNFVKNFVAHAHYCSKCIMRHKTNVARDLEFVAKAIRPDTFFKVIYGLFF